MQSFICSSLWWGRQTSPHLGCFQIKPHRPWSRCRIYYCLTLLILAMSLFHSISIHFIPFNFHSKSRGMHSGTNPFLLILNKNSLELYQAGPLRHLPFSFYNKSILSWVLSGWAAQAPPLFRYNYWVCTVAPPLFFSIHIKTLLSIGRSGRPGTSPFPL